MFKTMEDIFIFRAIDSLKISVHVVTREYNTIYKEAMVFQCFHNIVHCHFWHVIWYTI
jgi:hypothetical protein